MFATFELNRAGFEGKYEVINIDYDDNAKDRLIEAGFTTVPILEVNGELIQDVSEMTEAISKVVV